MSDIVYLILLLYIAFRAKQFICDFLLQTSWMALHKGDPGLAGYKALGAHTAIHALGTLSIMLLFAPYLWWLALVDFVIHGGADRIKAAVTAHYGFNTRGSAFWYLLGLDQEIHNFTHLGYIILIVATL